jgi:hypothetical protein
MAEAVCGRREDGVGGVRGGGGGAGGETSVLTGVPRGQ